MRTLVWLTFALALAAQGAEIHIRVTDESGKNVWARIEVRGASGRMFQPAGAILDEPIDRKVRGGQPYYRGSFVVEGECSLTVLPGVYTVVAERGLEFERVERQVEVAANGSAELELQPARWVHMRERGWYSGDLHVHRPLEQMEALAEAEDVNLSVDTTIWNDRNYWFGRSTPEDLVIRASDDHLITFMNGEDERGGGAWMLVGLPGPVSLHAEGRWYPPGIRFVERARAAKKAGSLFPWFEIEKPIWWEAPLMMAMAAPDSIGLLHNHFNQYGMLDNEAWGPARDTSEFPGQKGFADYTLQLYYRYLNLGFRVPPTAGSASGVLPDPLGYNRVYVPLEGEFTPETWFAALKRGRTMVTNGPVLLVDSDITGGQITLQVEALAREPIDRVEVVADGKVIDRFSAGGQNALKRTLSYDTGARSWIAVRCFLETKETVRLAHTSPVFLRDRAKGCADDARYFVDWMDRLISETTPERFATPAQRHEVLGLYLQARTFYADKVASCQAP